MSTGAGSMVGMDEGAAMGGADDDDAGSDSPRGLDARGSLLGGPQHG